VSRIVAGMQWEQVRGEDLPEGLCREGLF